MTKVKLCGLSRESDIAAVNKLKPDLVGFVFAKKSKRYVSPEQAAALKSLLAPGILAAGVFVNEPVEAVAELLDHGVIDVAQLHGSEDDDYIARLRALTGLEHGKLTAERDELQKQIAYFKRHKVDFIVLVTPDKEYAEDVSGIDIVVSTQDEDLFVMGETIDGTFYVDAPAVGSVGAILISPSNVVSAKVLQAS